MAILLALMLVVTSVNSALAARPEAGEDEVVRLRAQGPTAVVQRDGRGRIVPKKQNTPAANEWAAQVADTLQRGSAKGYLEVGVDFGVQITAKGRDFAQDVAERFAGECNNVLAVGADWTGFQVELEATCSEAEVLERYGGDSLDRPGANAPATISAAGFAAPPPTRPEPEAVTSSQYGCLIGFATLGSALVWAAATVISPFTGWLSFIFTWSRISAMLFTGALMIAGNCTEVFNPQARRQIWHAYLPGGLPFAHANLAPLIRDVFEPPEQRDDVWVTVTVNCTHYYYSSYVWDKRGYQVPTYKRVRC